ncbi:uncharacterized protein PFL1_02527 [Pseudozyma flocculosa PF-1]|uniref:Zn(2)-C6 fungal-type domain-containing protein n=2 Tax=Pseudozyma flocculosa TaxID=84751 RepID=A0A5C3EZ91_9BASI|nr:uncharacterized protein PFL1_02527 [Pseudozyma flocculosa PF-1]EPQ29854.1 hypothetical protein PFL1_02527 [Pseudozyma flocculosa PF-1]SPO37150.1 uncharacterized protein PSFLO_02622 [Pseudozyma flocculosa]
MSAAPSSASALPGQATFSIASSSDHAAGHTSGEKKDDEDSRKRKRIQQACRSCGVKRVKCDGLKPCTTCIKSGETCEYGQPKKRGPPKGSTRGGTKAAARRAAQLEAQTSARNQARQNAEALEAHGTTPWQFSQLPASAPVDPRYAPTGPYRDGAGTAYQPYATIPSGREVRPPLSTGSQSSQRFGMDSDRGRYEGSIDGFAAASRGSFSTSSIGGDSASSPQSTSTAEARRPPETIFHGTTSGLGILRAQSGDRRLPPLFFTPPSHDGSVSGQPSLDRESRADYAREMTRSFRSPHWGASSERMYQDRRLSDTTSPPTAQREVPRSQGAGPSEPERHLGSAPAMSQTMSGPERMSNTRLRLHLDRGLASMAEASGAAPEAPSEIDLEPLLWDSPDDAQRLPCRGGISLTKPVVPRPVVERVFTIVWGILQTSWPLLYKPALPLIGQYDVIDEEKRPLLYNTVAALASRGWFDGNVSDSDDSAPVDTAKTQSDLDEVKLAGVPGHTLTYLDGTTRPVTTVELSSIFLVRAKYYLLKSCNEPSLEAVQSQLIMSLREQGIGHPTQAAMYQHMACRMAIDLGLHRHCDFSTTLGISFSHAEEQERRRAFWMSYILDKASGASLGKPANLRDHEVDCPFPNRDEPDEHEIWAEVAGGASLVRDEARPLLLKTPHRAMSHFLAVIRLAQISERILGLYNSVRDKLPPKEREEGWEAKLLGLHLQLEELQNNLGPDLQIEEPQNCLPNRLCLNLWLSVNKLILHRPHILKVPKSEGMPSSHQVCWQEVGRICRIIETYGKNFGLRKLSQTFVYAIFTSCTIEIANTTSMDAAVASEAKRRLRVLMGALPSISGTWRSASLHLDILKRLAHGIDADVDGTGIDSRPQGLMIQPPTVIRPIGSGDFGGVGADSSGGVVGGSDAMWRKPPSNGFNGASLPSSAAAPPSQQQQQQQQQPVQHQQQQPPLQQQQMWQASALQPPPLERRGRSSLSVAMNLFDSVPGPLGAPMDFSRSRNSLFGSGPASGEETPTFLGDVGNANGNGIGSAPAATGGQGSVGLLSAGSAQNMAQQDPMQIQATMASLSNPSYVWAPSLDATPFDASRGFAGVAAGSGNGGAGGGGSNLGMAADLSANPASAPVLQAPGLFSGGLSQTSSGVDNGFPTAGGFAGGNPNLDTDAMLRFHDASYWGSMPLNSEDPLSWANFTNSYVEALASVLDPHGIAGGDPNQQPQQQGSMQQQQQQQPPPQQQQQPQPQQQQRQPQQYPHLHPQQQQHHPGQAHSNQLGLAPPPSQRTGLHYPA